MYLIFSVWVRDNLYLSRSQVWVVWESYPSTGSQDLMVYWFVRSLVGDREVVDRFLHGIVRGVTESSWRNVGFSRLICPTAQVYLFGSQFMEYAGPRYWKAAWFAERVFAQLGKWWWWSSWKAYSTQHSQLGGLDGWFSPATVRGVYINASNPFK